MKSQTTEKYFKTFIVSRDFCPTEHEPFQPCRPKHVFANSVDPDEMTHHELSHHVLHCLPFCFDF